MMYCSMEYKTPIGNAICVSNGESLTGLWLEGQKHFLGQLKELPLFHKDKVLQMTEIWLDDYFAGKNPGISSLPLAPSGSEFRMKVWDILKEIPYGETVTYGDIARKISGRMSAQAVGGAVGSNPISIIIPCHRVIGANGKLVGYDGGTDKKLWLLEHENKNRHPVLF